MSRIGRTILAGLAGGAAMNVAMFLTFRLLGFGWNGDGILITSSLPSRKLVAVWTEIAPLPLIVTNPLPMIIGLTLFFGSATQSYTTGSPHPGRVGSCQGLAGWPHLFSS